MYPRDARHLDSTAMQPAKRDLVEALQAAFGGTDDV